MALVLHSTGPALNPRAGKALIAAAYNGVSIETRTVNLGSDNKSKDFLALNPNGKIPVLETPEGAIFESNAIARYVARLNGDRHHLLGRNAYEAALVDQWIEWSRFELELPSSSWLYPIWGYADFNEAATEAAKKDIQNAMNILNRHLALRTFLVGERVTLADIVVAAIFRGLYSTVLDPNARKSFGNLNRWYLTVAHQSEVHGVFGEPVLTDKAKVAEKKAPAPAPAAAAPAAAAAAADDEDEDKPKKKPANPLALLPPSKLNLEEWKRVYTNAKNTRDACKWFWENYDAEGYSVYFCEYKYPEDNQKNFMTCNLLGGFIQHSDPLRPFAFASLLLLGAEPRIEIGGVWVFRGNGIPQEMKDNATAESYEFTRVDTNDEAQRKLVDDYFCWEGEFVGRKGDKTVIDGKNFK